MIRVLVATILWVCLLPATAHAQPTLANLEAISPVPLGEWDFEGGQLHFPETVFGSLPAAGTSGRIYIVTDATTSSDCSAGGGTARALCRDTGATWESIGGGGGGGGNSFVTWDMPVGTDPVADSATDTITFVCPPPMVCAGNSSTDTLTLSVTTPTPTLSATPTPTVTTTAFACDPGFALDQAHPEACVELPTPDGGANFPTPTVVESVTPTPVVCQTNAAYGLGGLFKANPEACQAVGPTPTPTATASVTPTATTTSAPTPTTTAVNCPTAYGGILGGLFGAHPEQCLPIVTPTNTATASVTATATASPTPTATASQSPTATNTASPMPVSTASPGLAGAVLGTSLMMARADHVHPMPDSGVSGGSYINSNITVNAKGLITAASDGTAFPNSFQLYAEKWGTDSSTCGSPFKPCAGIGTTEGVFAKILANNDNGFYTCSSNGSDGCGQCATTSTACNENADCGGTATSCSGATCCAAYTCSNNASRGCGYTTSVSPYVVAADADCTGGGTCGANTSGACTVSGTCTGPLKSYIVQLGAGDWIESLTGTDSSSNVARLPSPGYVSIAGVARSSSRIYTLSDAGTIDLSNRTFVSLSNFTATALSNGPAIFSTGRAVQIGFDRNGAVASGTVGAVSFVNNLDCTASGLPAYAAACCTGYHTGTCGNGNGTWTIRGSLFWQYGLLCGGAPLDLTLKGLSCSHDSTMACTGASNCNVCTGGANAGFNCTADSQCPGGACTVSNTCSGASSGDIDIKEILIQTDCPSLDAYGARIRYDACGTNYNQLFDGITMLVGNPGPGASYGLRVEESSCNLNSVASLQHQGNGSLWKNIIIEGNTNTGGYVPPDVSLSIGKDTGIWINGPFAYNACTRELQNGPGSITYTDSANSDQKGLGGGAGHDLGVLWCAEPKRVCVGGTNVRTKCTAASECPGGTCPIKDGEFWYARTLNGTPVATSTATPTVTVTTTPVAGASATPTPTRTPTWTPTPSPTKTSATATPTATATPFGGARYSTGGKTFDVQASEDNTTSDGGTFSLKRLDGVSWFSVDDSTALGGRVVIKGARSFMALKSASDDTLLDCADSDNLCTVNTDPTAALGVATKQYVDARAPKVRPTPSAADTSGTLTDDTVLKAFAVAAGVTYLVEGDLYVVTNAAGAEVKLAWQGASGDACGITTSSIGADATSASPQRNTDCDNSPASPGNINLQSGDNFVRFSGFFTANGAGTLDLQFSVGTTGSGNSALLGSGSWMRVVPVQ